MATLEQLLTKVAVAPGLLSRLGQGFQKLPPVARQGLMGAGGGLALSALSGPDAQGQTHHLQNMAAGAAGTIAGSHLGGYVADRMPGFGGVRAGRPPTAPAGLLPANLAGHTQEGNIFTPPKVAAAYEAGRAAAFEKFSSFAPGPEMRGMKTVPLRGGWGGTEEVAMTPADHFARNPLLQQAGPTWGPLLAGLLHPPKIGGFTGSLGRMALQGAVPGAIMGALQGGEGHRLEGAGRGALGGAAGGVIGGGLGHVGGGLAGMNAGGLSNDASAAAMAALNARMLGGSAVGRPLGAMFGGALGGRLAGSGVNQPASQMDPFYSQYGGQYA